MSDLTADQVMSNLRPSTQNKLLDRITELEAEVERLRAICKKWSICPRCLTEPHDALDECPAKEADALAGDGEG